MNWKGFIDGLEDILFPGWREQREGQRRVLTLSSSITSEIDIPAPEHCEFLPFQKAGIQYAISQVSCIIGDEPGLGKTIEVLGYINKLGIKRVTIICPVSAKIHWSRECGKWLVGGQSVGFDPAEDPDILIVNYEQLHGLDRSSELIVVDEFHKIKNPKAKRSQRAYALIRRSSRKLFLSGTPIWNEPMDLFPILQLLNVSFAMDRKRFERDFCKTVHTRFGAKIEGVRSPEEFQKLLRSTVMIRRLKKDVLPELPPKRRQIIELAPPPGMENEVVLQSGWWGMFETELHILTKARDEAGNRVLSGGDEAEYREAVQKLDKYLKFKMSECSEIRRKTSLAKIPVLIQYLDDCIEQYGKIVVWGWHREVIRSVKEHFGEKCVSLMGGDSAKKRQDAIDRFQTDPNVKIFVGTMGAGGVAITLTEAELVVFAELDWVPNTILQAEDRCHRIGQKKSLMIQHLVIDGTIDCRIAKTMVAKQEMMEKSLDTETLW